MSGEDGDARARWRAVMDQVQAYAIELVSTLGAPNTGVTTVMHSGFDGTEPVVAVATSLPSRAAVRGVLSFAVAQSLEADGVESDDMSGAAVVDLDAFMSGGSGGGDRGWYRWNGAMRRQLGELDLFVNGFGEWVVSGEQGVLSKGSSPTMASAQGVCELWARAWLELRATRA